MHIGNMQMLIHSHCAHLCAFTYFCCSRTCICCSHWRQAGYLNCVCAMLQCCPVYSILMHTCNLLRCIWLLLQPTLSRLLRNITCTDPCLPLTLLLPLPLATAPQISYRLSLYPDFTSAHTYAPDLSACVWASLSDSVPIAAGLPSVGLCLYSSNACSSPVIFQPVPICYRQCQPDFVSCSLASICHPCCGLLMVYSCLIQRVHPARLLARPIGTHGTLYSLCLLSVLSWAPSQRSKRGLLHLVRLFYQVPDNITHEQL